MTIVALFAFMSVTMMVAGYCYGVYCDRRKSAEMHEHFERENAESRRAQRTADMVAIADEVKDITAALLKHEERLSAVELIAEGPARRRP